MRTAGERKQNSFEVKKKEIEKYILDCKFIRQYYSKKQAEFAKSACDCQAYSHALNISSSPKAHIFRTCRVSAKNISINQIN